MQLNLASCILHLVREFINQDFFNWMIDACDRGDLVSICELLQWEVSNDELRVWHVFARSQKQKHVVQFWIDHFIDRGVRITNEDPLFDVLKHNHLDFASKLQKFQNPTDTYFATLFGIVTKGTNDDKLQFAIARYETFREYWFENQQHRHRMLKFFDKQFSNFVLEHGLSTGLFDNIDCNRFNTWISNRIPTEIFRRIYTARYQKEFKLNMFCFALECVHMGVIAFLAQLQDFYVSPQRLHFDMHVQSDNTYQWLFNQDPKLYLPLLAQTYFLSCDSGFVVLELPAPHLNRVLCWLLDSLSPAQLDEVLKPMFKTLDDHKCYKRKEFLKDRYLLHT